jgi:replicative DNA helicase
MIDPTSEGSCVVADLKRAPRRKAKIERTPPHSNESEMGVIGCALLDYKLCLPKMISRFGRDEVMYDLRHQAMCWAMIDMFERNLPIDVITLRQWLKNDNKLEAVGGDQYIAVLPDCVPSVSNVDYYIEIVHEKFLLRKMIATCTEAVGRIYDTESEVDQMLDGVERDVMAVRNLRRGLAGRKEIKKLVREAITIIEDNHLKQGAGMMGVPTGLVDLDRMCKGCHPGEMIVIAAKPSVGKTSLAMNIAVSAAIDHKIPVGIFSAEMVAIDLTLRALCTQARVNLRSIDGGDLVESDFPKLTNAASKLANAPIYIDDLVGEQGGNSIYRMRAEARRMVQEHGIKLFVIDYLQLFNAEGARRRIESRHEEVAAVSNCVKSTAKELNVPVIVLSQLTEDGKGNTKLRGSADIGQDADKVWRLVREETDDAEADATQLTDKVTLWVDKQRNGPRGAIQLIFLKAYTKFECVSKVAE